jgi:hypothetical protein
MFAIIRYDQFIVFRSVLLFWSLPMVAVVTFRGAVALRRASQKKRFTSVMQR